MVPGHYVGGSRSLRGRVRLGYSNRYVGLGFMDFGFTGCGGLVCRFWSLGT